MLLQKLAADLSKFTHQQPSGNKSLEERRGRKERYGGKDRWEREIEREGGGEGKRSELY